MIILLEQIPIIGFFNIHLLSIEYSYGPCHNLTLVYAKGMIDKKPCFVCSENLKYCYLGKF